MKKLYSDKLSAVLFKKTGLLCAAVTVFYAAVFVSAKFFKDHFPEAYNIDLFLLFALCLCAAGFAFSAFRASFAWLQPSLLFVIAPVVMSNSAFALFGIGAFMTAGILLYHLGFFERHRRFKFAVLVVYFWLCELAASSARGKDISEIALSSVSLFVLLGSLLLIYTEAWSAGARSPKPSLSLSDLKITKKETEYLMALLGGQSIKAIAINVGVKESTVRNTLVRIYKKFGVSDKSGLMVKCENYSLAE